MSETSSAGEPRPDGVPSNPFAAPVTGTRRDAFPAASGFASPQASQPGHDQPPFAPPTPGPSAYSQPAYGQPAYGQPAYGQPAGEVPQGQPGYGEAAYAQSPLQPGQPYPSFGAPPYFPGTLGKPFGSTSGKATAVLVLGIAAIPGLVICGAGFVAAIVALCLAPGANREIRASAGALTGVGQVRAGRILAVIALLLGVLIVAAYVAIIAFAARHGGSSGRGIDFGNIRDT